MYIFTFHIVKNHTKSAVFFFKISMITNVILILYDLLYKINILYDTILPTIFLITNSHITVLRL